MKYISKYRQKKILNPIEYCKFLKKKKKLDNYFYRNEDTNYLMSGTNYQT